jgi:hypothetical protein
MSADERIRAVLDLPGWFSLRLLWLVPGLAIGLLAGRQAEEQGLGLAGLAILLAFGIAPHLPIVLAFVIPHAPGQLPPRAVPLFNATHHPVAPVVLLLLGAAGLLSPIWSVGALAWLSHIVVDLALGDGRRTRDGWRRAWWPR